MQNNTYPQSHIVINSDGSCRGNPGPGGYAAFLQRIGSDGEQISKKIVKGFDPSRTTNQRMEMMAAIKALEFLKPDELDTIYFRTDSNYVVQGMNEWVAKWVADSWRTSGKKEVANRDLWEALVAASTGKKIVWQWVKGHAGDTMNETVHKLAFEQMEKAYRQAVDTMLSA